MARRDARDVASVDQAARSYIQSAAGSSTSVADEVNRLASLGDQGVLAEQEFAAQKAKLLA